MGQKGDQGPVRQSVGPSVHQSVGLPAKPPVCPLVCLCIRLSVRLSSICPLVRLFVCLSICPSVVPSVCLCLLPSYFFLPICQVVFLSAWPHLSGPFVSPFNAVPPQFLCVTVRLWVAGHGGRTDAHTRRKMDRQIQENAMHVQHRL